MEHKKDIDRPDVLPDSRPEVSNILDEEASLVVEALLFASPTPLSSSQLACLAGRRKSEIPGIIDDLNRQYSDWKRSFRIERFGDSYRFYTLPEFDTYLSRLAAAPKPAKLSRAALEVLAIIAYKQPVVKSEIERIRGVSSDGVIRTLLEKGLVEVSGRCDRPGRPMTYRTTQEFLEFFGISGLSELPSPEELEVESEGTHRLSLVQPSDPSAPDSG